MKRIFAPGKICEAISPVLPPRKGPLATFSLSPKLGFLRGPPKILNPPKLIVGLIPFLRDFGFIPQMDFLNWSQIFWNLFLTLIPGKKNRSRSGSSERVFLDVE